ncbi:MAG: hypothetical protein JNM76_02550 [Betaproteobacteria bacterium]|nr:hypothetical protein [Betaproteobacteria bacterium]
MNNQGDAVVVYVRPGTDILCYRVGQFSPDGVSMLWRDEQTYDLGYFPSVSLNDDGVVISVQETNNGISRRMFYRVGRLSGPLIKWGPEQPHYDTGFRPSVSINNSGCIAEVHQSANVLFPYNLHCWFGNVDQNTLTVRWSGNAQFSTGSVPNVSLNNNNQLLVVQKTRGDGWALWYRTGKANLAAGVLVFNPENPSIGDGFGPRVSMNDRGDALMVNVTADILRSNTTQVRVGSLDSAGTALWSYPETVGDNSNDMTVALDNLGESLLTGRFSIGSDSISTRKGFYLTDRSNWMKGISPLLAAKSLRSVILPGTHDSGTSSVTSNSNFSPDAPWEVTKMPRMLVELFARAQGLTIAEQLQAGVRYFDLRPAPDGVELRFAHSLFGDLVLPAIDAVSAFLDSHPLEIVILDFQHFFAMGDAEHDRLLGHLQHTLAGKMIPPGNPSNMRIDDLWAQGKQVAVIYTPAGGGQRILDRHRNIWNRNQYVRSPWANTERMADLRSFLDLETRSPPADRLFVYQGVLTPHWQSYATLSSLEYLARINNETIVSWAEKDWKGRPLNIIMVDFSQFGDLLPAVVRMNIE